MKATGIVRRIDDLGRVVVPKEIRRTLRIREGDPLEIYTDREGEIILKKYSPINELSQFAKQYTDSISQITGHIICIADRDQIIAASGGSKKELISKPISKELEDLINQRENIMAAREDKTFVKITDEYESDFTYEVVAPIIAEGDAIGAIIMLSKEEKIKFSEVEVKISAIASIFLGKQMEQ